MSIVYKMGRSADQVLVTIEHVFEPSKPQPLPDSKSESEPVTITKPVKQPGPLSEPVSEPEPVVKPMNKVTPSATPKPLAQLQEKQAPLEQQPLEAKPVKPVEAKQIELKQVKAKQNESKGSDKNALTKDKAFAVMLENRDMPIASGETQAVLDDKMMKHRSQKDRLTLPSKEYFDAYNQWQAQGQSLDKDKKPVPLRIQHLEKAYDLFQMKVVAFKNKMPHTDLGDGSRVAGPSLSEFSTTCFVVANPWEKWGQALEESGFNKKDDVQVRYYTYEFVRNAIYARAMTAFEWSLEKKGLPLTTDPSRADVLGDVYAVHKDGGGRFGVFVPRRVDFQSQDSVKIDPMACFKGQKDIEALVKAGLL
ncbi:uncharacterized protein TOL2_C00820 [Desulfobacula toluolica Tol2]|uniref:Uncharacterized protein n=1 Tax=Desulfobacula toluolica (strain DSM 7467 / Tol2) TaxID=651182 RepID=K0NGX3_DESTT|nr:uncharacterized protein TOL2_C00820 [Desulfobacula toluolica Tol2]